MADDFFSHPGRHCRGVHTSLFFIGTGNATEARQAKSVCAGCPVLDECMEYAVADPELSGVWGGTSFLDRREIRKARGSTSRMSRVKNPAACGTPAGYNRHRMAGEASCESCKEARRAYEAERKARQRQALGAA